MTAETFSVRLPAEMKRELEEFARATQRSSAFIVKEAVEAHLTERRAYLAAIEEALAEADASGEAISWEATSEWLKSWGTDRELPPPNRISLKGNENPAAEGRAPGFAGSSRLDRGG